MAACDVDALVVGAGVVGLACGLALAQRGASVIVAEREARAGEGVSSRNSGVIHAGLYYPPGSLKARLCLSGRDRLYAFCAQHRLPHRRTGKWVVAIDAAECEALAALAANAEANGTGSLRWLDRDQLARAEPALRAAAALDVPQTGIVDSAELVLALSGVLQQAGGVLACGSAVERVVPESDGFAVFAGSEPLRCRWLVNAAGLSAQAVAASIETLPAGLIPPLHPASGHYYRCARPVPFSRLVYPLPGRSGLGVHLGYDPAGRPRFGPDVRFPGRIDYRFDDSQRAAFAAGIRRWWPQLEDADLQPDFVGVRPKLVGPAEPTPDFCIQGAEQHGLNGLINLFGIESPGLTACLALGDEVADRLLAR